MISSSVVRGLVRILNWAHSHPSPGRREKATSARVVPLVAKAAEAMWKHRALLPFSFHHYNDAYDEEDPVVSLVILFMHCKRFIGIVITTCAHT